MSHINGEKMAKSDVIEIKRKKEIERVKNMTQAQKLMEAIELSHACDKLKKAVKRGSVKRS